MSSPSPRDRQTPADPSVSVIVVTWNGRQWLDRCLTALLALDPPAAELVLVDNGSTDGTAAYVRERYPSIRVVALGRNEGFAGGNNAGARHATSTYLAFVNNDAVVEQSWLGALRAPAEEDATVGLVTSRIVFLERPEIVDSAGDGYLRCGGAFKRDHGRQTGEARSQEPEARSQEVASERSEASPRARSGESGAPASAREGGAAGAKPPGGSQEPEARSQEVASERSEASPRARSEATERRASAREGGAAGAKPPGGSQEPEARSQEVASERSEASPRARSEATERRASAREGGSAGAKPPGSTEDVFGACGAAFLIRRDLFEALGGFDDDFFMVYEDVDLSYRARLLGARCVYAPAAVARHAGSATIGAVSARQVFYGQRNLEWTWIKNTPARLLWRSWPGHVAYDLAGALSYARQGHLGAWTRGKLAALAGLPRMLRKRRAVQRARRVDPDALWRVMDTRWLAIKRREKTFDFAGSSADRITSVRSPRSPGT